MGASFTWVGGNGGAALPDDVEDGAKSLPSSGMAVSFAAGFLITSAFAPAEAAGADPLLPLTVVASVGVVASDEAGASVLVAGAVPVPVVAAPVAAFNALTTLAVAERTISGALACFGSTSVGSPVVAACETSGPFLKFSISLL